MYRPGNGQLLQYYRGKKVDARRNSIITAKEGKKGRKNQWERKNLENETGTQGELIEMDKLFSKNRQEGK